MASYVRKVKTSSGATAVQIVVKRGGVRQIVEHLGSAHDDVELAVLLQVARERLAGGQDELDLGLAAPAGPPSARVVSSSCRLLWQVLTDAYSHLVTPHHQNHTQMTTPAPSRPSADTP